MTKSILRDVAAAAGVSLRTASRVLNDDPKVAVDTRARVQHAMRDLSFTPDSMARSLRAGTDTALGMVVESVADPFFSAMVAAVEKAGVQPAASRCSSPRRTETPTASVTSSAQMLSRRIAGMLLTPTAGDHAWLRTQTPLVLVDRAAPGLDADVVGIDDEAAAADAVNHLVAHGHRRIAYVSDHPLVPTSRARLAGYRRAMAAHGLDVDPRLVRAECPDPASAAAATRELLAGNGSDPDRTAERGHPLLARRRTHAARHRSNRRRAGLLRRLRHGRPAATRCHGGRPLGRGGRRGRRHPARPTGSPTPTSPVSTIHVPVGLIARGSGELRP